MQQYCIKWNNHMKNFQSTLPKYFQNQKFLDCTLVVEGEHLVSCHKFVLDACSDYFAGFLKNKILDDKNLVICLPQEIKLWEIQALLQFMYHGQVCISQEGLSSLVKCAEMLKVKGLCGNESTSIISKEKSSPTKPNTDTHADTNDQMDDDLERVETDSQKINSSSEMIVETNENENDSCEFDDQIIIKRELNISDNSEESPESPANKLTSNQSAQALGLIRVKQNLFESNKEVTKNSTDDAGNSLVYNKKSMDIYVKPPSKDNEMDGSSRSSTPLLIENEQEFENIVCSPTLMQYPYDSEVVTHLNERAIKSDTIGIEECEENSDDELFIEEANLCTNDALFNMISQKFENCEAYSQAGDETSLRKNLLIASVGSLNNQFQTNVVSSNEVQSLDNSSDMKMAIGGLYLRNPRGNQVRQYDVNALYNALQDVKNGHSIYRAAQTYSIPRKTLRNWMKRLHIKSQYPMPKQLKQAAERKKNSQIQGVGTSINLVDGIDLPVHGMTMKLTYDESPKLRF